MLRRIGDELKRWAAGLYSGSGFEKPLPEGPSAQIVGFQVPKSVL